MTTTELIEQIDNEIEELEETLRARLEMSERWKQEDAKGDMS